MKKITLSAWEDISCSSWSKLKEYNTCKKIEEELDKIGLLHKRVGETGVYAWIDGEKGEGKTIASGPTWMRWQWKT